MKVIKEILVGGSQPLRIIYGVWKEMYDDKTCDRLPKKDFILNLLEDAEGKHIIQIHEGPERRFEWIADPHIDPPFF